tara:strand:- start:1437 stop:1961 length:525 start_codon:yes stop_codon:yes gene_type:complete
MKNFFSLTIFIFSISSFACSDILNSTLRVLDSDDEQNLCDYSGNVVLVVNVASRCGYTPQYAGLQRLYTKYKDDGLTVIGIPSRDFRQEFSAEAKVAEFCSTEYGVEFPMFATAKVKGKKAHPFYKKLIAASGKEPRWNFAKYLIGRDGEVIEHYKSSVTPESERLVAAIEAVL